MKYMLIVAIALLLCSCYQKLSNDEIITIVKKCNDAGLDAIGYSRNTTQPIVDIQCGKIKQSD